MLGASVISGDGDEYKRKNESLLEQLNLLYPNYVTQADNSFIGLITEYMNPNRRQAIVTEAASDNRVIGGSIARWDGKTDFSSYPDQ